MTFEIKYWNLTPNKTRYVRLAPSPLNSGEMSISVHNEVESARSGEIGIAYSTVNFGSFVSVYLIPSGETVIGTHFNEFTWHMQVSGISGELAKVYKVNPFSDINEIRHPIYQNADLAYIRGVSEIDLRTHATRNTTVQFGTHYPDLLLGDSVTINSSRRGLPSGEYQIIRKEINALVDTTGDAKIVDTIDVVEYYTLKR